MPLLFMHIAFGLWVFFMLTALLIVICKPALANATINRSHKFTLRNLLDLCISASAAAWLAMWCFRSMY